MTNNHKPNLLNMFMIIDRYAAWVLLIVIIFYAITGFGITKNIIDPTIANILHSSVLGAIGIIAFCIHTSWAIHCALKRWRLWNNLSKIILILIYLILFSGFTYLSWFYNPYSNL